MAEFDLEAYKNDLASLSGFSPEERLFALKQKYSSSDDASFQNLLNKVFELNTPQAIRERVQIQSELDKERMKEAGKYKMLFGIPETISQTFGNQATMNVLGARSITDAYNAALQAYPNTQFATTAYNPRSYFS